MNRGRLPGDRRGGDRRSDDVRLGDYTIPELRKALVTGGFLLGVFALFAYMVGAVLVAAILGVVIGAYLIPFCRRLQQRLGSPAPAAILTIALVTVPLVAILVYSWAEVTDAARYLEANRVEVARRLTVAMRRLPLAGTIIVQEDLARWVAAVANRSGAVVGELQEALGIIIVSVAVCLFTIYYVLTDHEKITDYLKRKVPGRYRDLAAEISHNIRAVVYGALYATFFTQILKSAVIFSMNLIWEVPLAAVLAIASFFIGFFPIVGSWTVYVPVAIYLMVFRQDYVAGLMMLGIGFFGITLFVSMYLRPRIAAEKSHVLNFYWMFIALVTGVYTFGLVGIIIGPVLVGVLKAVFDTVTGDAGPTFVEAASIDRTDRPAAG